MLKFYYGVMGAGKTTELIKTYEIYKRKGMNPVVIKPCLDNREGEQSGWGITSSRLTKDSVPAYYFKNLQDELPKLDYDVLLVDEAQFLSNDDVLFLSEVTDRKGIDVLSYGLKTDINGNLFGGAASLLAIGDETKELEYICDTPLCQEKATMHLRYVDGKIDIGGNTIAIEKGDITYKSVCRKCWKKAHSER